MDVILVAFKACLGEQCTGLVKVMGSGPVQSLKFFSGLCSSSVMAAFASIIISTLNCYCWTSTCITMEFIYLSQVLGPLNIKGQTHA